MHKEVIEVIERPQEERDDADSENPHAELSLTLVGPHFFGDGSIAYVRKVKTLRHSRGPSTAALTSMAMDARVPLRGHSTLG